MNSITVIGIDCSATRGKTGLARAEFEDGKLGFISVQLDRSGRAVHDILADWLSPDRPNLLAMDAPMGWPEGLSAALVGHAAGLPLGGDANDLFKRRTDRLIQKRLGVQPFSVGADRIARTAHAALRTIGLLAEARGAIPLAWDPSTIVGTQVIEVYPSATRKAWGDREVHRREVLLAGDQLPVSGGHARDACTCLIAAEDFLNGNAVSPIGDDRALAIREGWIWAAEKARVGCSRIPVFTPYE